MATKKVPVIRSRLKELIARKEHQIGKAIQYGEIAEQTGLNAHTITRWMRPDAFSKIEADTAIELCKYLGCGLGDLLYIDFGSSET